MEDSRAMQFYCNRHLTYCIHTLIRYTDKFPDIMFQLRAPSSIFSPGRLYIGRRNESARADRRVMRKKTGASTILKEIEENRDFELFSSSGHFSQSFWCQNDLNGKMVKIFIWLKGLCAVMVKQLVQENLWSIMSVPFYDFHGD